MTFLRASIPREHLILFSVNHSVVIVWVGEQVTLSYSMSELRSNACPF